MNALLCTKIPAIIWANVRGRDRSGRCRELLDQADWQWTSEGGIRVERRHSGVWRNLLDGLLADLGDVPDLESTGNG